MTSSYDLLSYCVRRRVRPRNGGVLRAHLFVVTNKIRLIATVDNKQFSFLRSIILFSDNVNMEFSGQDGALFKGTKNGKIYLTTHRMIFNSKTSSDPMQSFSFPFVCLTDVRIQMEKESVSTI